MSHHGITILRMCARPQCGKAILAAQGYCTYCVRSPPTLDKQGVLARYEEECEAQRTRSKQEEGVPKWRTGKKYDPASGNYIPDVNYTPTPEALPEDYPPLAKVPGGNGVSLKLRDLVGLVVSSKTGRLWRARHVRGARPIKGMVIYLGPGLRKDQVEPWEEGVWMHKNFFHEFNALVPLHGSAEWHTRILHWTETNPFEVALVSVIVPNGANRYYYVHPEDLTFLDAG